MSSSSGCIRALLFSHSSYLNSYKELQRKQEKMKSVGEGEGWLQGRIPSMNGNITADEGEVPAYGIPIFHWGRTKEQMQQCGPWGLLFAKHYRGLSETKMKMHLWAYSNIWHLWKATLWEMQAKWVDKLKSCLQGKFTTDYAKVWIYAAPYYSAKASCVDSLNLH